MHSMRVIRTLALTLILSVLSCTAPAQNEGGLTGSDGVQTPDTSSEVSNEVTAPECATDTDCATGDPCQIGTCMADGTCQIETAADGTLCEDGSVCTENDQCTAGACVPGLANPDCAESCLSDDECAEGDYCMLDSCGGDTPAGNPPGLCIPKPDQCPGLYEPVCGCDGATYNNTCEAAVAGANVAAEGPCECNAIECAGAAEGVDTNGDGCANSCLVPCDSTCGCYGVDDLNFAQECPLDCIGCGNYWTCEQGYCQSHCDVIPEEAQACMESFGCDTNDDCSEGTYCAKKDGECDSVGTCVESPDQCPLDYDPVCACDGATYDNACKAAVAGTNIASLGACVSVCGTIAGIPCAPGEFCELPAGICEVSDLAGVCVKIPDNCGKSWFPECGCDGVTYPNHCALTKAGVQQAHSGTCDCTPIQCQAGDLATDTNDDGCYDACVPCPAVQCASGQTATDANGDGCPDSCVSTECESNTDCADDQYCAQESCNAAKGVCVPSPKECPDSWVPVCGCDDQTYSNECEAAEAGVNIAALGECKSTCGTIAGIPCPDGNWCEQPAGSCNISDAAGECLAVPEVCTDEWKPVCGCDAKTYSNDCERQMAQVQKDHEGQCNCQFIIDCAPGFVGVDTDKDGCNDICEAITCTDNTDCGNPALYCKKADASCDAEGTCVLVPDFCTKEYFPVCGCDGNTYSNHCMAEAAGVNVVSNGACIIPCGGDADEECPKGLFCEYADGTCDTPDTASTADKAGTCVEKPAGCIALYAPVCGCDGNTYGNDCLRQLAGVSKAANGACSCVTNDDCNDISYCAADSCDAASGSCAPKPDKCIEIYKPVCGCDGKTYSNSCFAAAAGANVAAEGICEPVGTACTNNEDCEGNDYCLKGDAACDAPGTCTPAPDACDTAYKPVCGCDGKTYGNACLAAASGSNVSADGPCNNVCGTIVGIPCQDGQWCEPAPGTCNVSDSAGTCVELDNCSKDYKPECGCDGVTYPTACARILQMVAKDHDGACECADILCEKGTVATDTTGDSCLDSCLPCPAILCAPGTQPIDSNADGCDDSCVEVTCDSNADCGPAQFCASDKGLCGGPGVCQVKPEACPLVLAPVCGCDGKTYGNGCKAAAAGVNVASDGECTEKCGGFQGLLCPKSAFCEFEYGTCGAADLFGTCVDIPAICTDDWMPVCGCDGKTYSNDCERLAAQVQKDHNGTCECLIIIDCLPGFIPVDTDGDECPDSCEPLTCADNSDCGLPELLYCHLEPGSCGGEGKCTIKPEVCTKEYQPVCGCDGKTYGNACMASEAGASVSYEGVCSNPCGGLSDLECAKGTFCEYTEGTCGAIGSPGQCVAQPEGCVLPVYLPVCGCDGNTYQNDCTRQLAGVSKSYNGPCKCTDNKDCNDTSYCKQEGCGGTGVCTPMPQACTEEYQPVCGCDGQTYGNACSASAAGVTVASDGTCEGGNQCETNKDCPPSVDEGAAFCLKETGQCQGAGTCITGPDACSPAAEPVCGCDGDTYNNECDAHLAGVNVLHPGACEIVVPTCSSDEDCTPTQFCQTEPKSCGGEGTCVELPKVCIEIFAPVCGCDGETYSNKCLAAASGTSVDTEGPCKTEVQECEHTAQCDDNQYCEKDFCFGVGTCAPIPEICTDEDKPVCGCDGKTYGNECEAAAASMNAAYSGLCEPVVDVCANNEDCAAGLYCAREQSLCDGFGLCEPIPTICTKEYFPVCGCDGETYSNACHAAAGATGVASLGPCKPAIKDCETNADCQDNQYCERALGACDSAGTCVQKPDLCTLELNPVCGCDGKTYNNACDAAGNGISIQHQGKCEQLPGDCESNADCGVGTAGPEFCIKPIGSCNGPGQCIAVPKVCTDEDNPVCGCDGNTYSNACQAGALAVSIQYEGACETSTLCSSNADCDDGSYCAKNPMNCEEKGECQPMPVNCIEILKPVCGCDGNTYDNDCKAAAAGSPVAYEGTCQIDVTKCQANEECPDGSYCFTEAGLCGGEGVCTDQPQLCIEISAPVCGCDGQTYDNKCFAAEEGINVLYDGVCEPIGTSCSTNQDCKDTEVCLKKAGSCDANGTCAPKPNFCPLNVDPVCSCDGKTYNNACEALQAGVNVLHAGSCDIAVEFCSEKSECPSTTDGVERFCKYEAGVCGGTGICTDIPKLCFLNYDPVCGCDGNTYSNACKADTAGVSLSSDGACKCAPILCEPGTSPVDTDNDGCADTCKGACEIIIDCAPGFIPVDTDGDDCPDACSATCKEACDCYQNDLINFEEECLALCPTCDNFWSCDAGLCTQNCGPVPDDIAQCKECTPILCPKGTIATDTTNDGCKDTCVGCPDILCIEGTLPNDSDGDGCDDECKPICPPILCPPTSLPVDTDDDGCPDKCQPKCTPILCVDGTEPVDTDNDGCNDECKPKCTPIPCPPGTEPADTNNDGCPNECKPIESADCGGFQGLICPDGQFCDYPAGMCNAADMIGSCVAVVDICAEDKPVCGCDGKTYPNDCSRIKAGVQKSKDGGCGTGTLPPADGK